MGEGQAATGEAVRLQNRGDGRLPVPLPNETNRDQLCERTSHSKLCRKAGVPEHDLRGKITSHRARSTIATQLFNAKEPMSLFELQEWLGHRLPSSTQRY